MKRFLFYSATNRQAVSEVLAGIGVIRLRLVRAGLYLLLVLAVGTIGYSFIGKGQWSLLDCLYMTVITLTTVGYEEVLPINDVAGGRAFTIAIIVIGMGLVLYFASTLTAFFVDGSLGALFSEKKMRKKLEALAGHIVICGVGKTGYEVLNELVRSNRTCVALDTDRKRIDLVKEHFGERVTAIVGDGTQDSDLLNVGIERASGLVATLGEEVENLYCTLSARQLNPDLRIIVMSDNVAAEQKFKHAGADSVVYTSIIGGQRIASELIRPTVVTFLDLMLRDKDRNLRIEEITIPENSQIGGETLASAKIRQFGEVLVIAIRQHGAERYQYNPGPNTHLSEGDVLILLGELSCIERVKGHAAAKE